MKEIDCPYPRALLIPKPSEIPFLCMDAEPRMRESLEVDAFIVLDDPHSQRPLIVYKFIGKPVGLVIENFDHFKRGSWYTPMGDIHERFGTLFDSGTGRIILPQSEWAYLRRSDPIPEDLTYGTVNLQHVVSLATYAAYNTPSTRPSPDIVTKDKVIISRNAFRDTRFEAITINR